MFLCHASSTEAPHCLSAMPLPPLTLRGALDYWISSCTSAAFSFFSLLTALFR